MFKLVNGSCFYGKSEVGNFVQEFYECLSTDTKLTEGIAVGSVLREIDAASGEETLYKFNDSMAWEPAGSNPTGTINIIANGEHDVSAYAMANVQVPNPSTGTRQITENGTYDVTGYASAEVNVESSGGDTKHMVLDDNLALLETYGEGLVVPIPDGITTFRQLYDLRMFPYLKDETGDIKMFMPNEDTGRLEAWCTLAVEDEVAGTSELVWLTALDSTYGDTEDANIDGDIRFQEDDWYYSFMNVPSEGEE